MPKSSISSCGKPVDNIVDNLWITSQNLVHKTCLYPQTNCLSSTVLRSTWKTSLFSPTFTQASPPLTHNPFLLFLSNPVIFSTLSTVLITITITIKYNRRKHGI
jgi:hypothetical protein